MAVKDRETPRESYYRALGRDNMCLLWHLKELIGTLPVKHVLDVGAGMRVSWNICLPERLESAVAVDEDAPALKALLAEFDDPRLSVVEGAIGSLSPAMGPVDLVYCIQALPWLEDPATVLGEALATSPGYAVLANPEFTPEEIGDLRSSLPEHGDAVADALERCRARIPDLDALMEPFGYYPLVVYSSRAWRPTPEHRVRTVLYTPDRPDRTPYDIAKYIVQVNGKCTNNCPSCYVIKTDETMDAGIFHDLIAGMDKGDMICLRGGEPPLSENLIEDFILPALARGLHVVLESNGSFLGSARYGEYMDILMRENMELRLSLDREHFDFFPVNIRRARIGWIARFIDDALAMNINFGLYTLGMSMEQIGIFLEGFGVREWLKYVRPITRYSNISELPIRGKYVDLRGSVHDRMSGEFIRQSMYGSYEDVLADGADRVAMDLLPGDLEGS